MGGTPSRRCKAPSPPASRTPSACAATSSRRCASGLTFARSSKDLSGNRPRAAQLWLALALAVRAQPREERDAGLGPAALHRVLGNTQHLARLRLRQALEIQELDHL